MCIVVYVTIVFQVIIECDNDAKEIVLTCKDDASWDGSPVNCSKCFKRHAFPL